MGKKFARDTWSDSRMENIWLTVTNSMIWLKDLYVIKISPIPRVRPVEEYDRVLLIFYTTLISEITLNSKIWNELLSVIAPSM